MMNRRHFLSAAAGALAPSAASAVSRKPNVLLALADDLGYECLGAYGGTSYRTPNLDRMAADGVRFQHAYAQPLCTPTRMQLMTGLYNHRNWKAFGIMEPNTVTFGHRMKQAGYRTVMAGKWQFWSYNPPDYQPEWRGKGMKAAQSGFESTCVWHNGHTEDKGSRYGDPTYEENGKLYKDVKDKYGDDIFSSHILSFFDRHRSEPVFAYYPMALTHSPFNPTPRSRDWTGKRLKDDAIYFKDMVEYMDEVMGRLFAGLDRVGVRDHTLVLFYSDNGTQKGMKSRMGSQEVIGGKGLPTDAGTRVPLIAQWKGVTPRGRVLDDLVDSTDFLPTILEATGTPRLKDVALDGVSFAPQLRGQRGAPRDWTFCWHDPRPGWDKDGFTLQIYARDQRWKLYRDGRLYDIVADVLEERPIAMAGTPPEAVAARRKLQLALDRMLPR